MKFKIKYKTNDLNEALAFITKVKAELENELGKSQVADTNRDTVDSTTNEVLQVINEAAQEIYTECTDSGCEVNSDQVKLLLANSIIRSI